jgi:hypothetical protein
MSALFSRSGLTRVVVIACLAAVMAPVLAIGAPTVFQAGATDPCGTGGNAISCENSKPGDPMANWQVSGVGDTSIQGFATSMSVNLGQTESFKVQTTASSWHIDILRLGYYGGDGARLIATNIQPSAPQPQTQPSCLSDASTGLIDCGNWAVSASWTVPTTAVSGLYMAELVRNDTGGKSQIPFVVRDDASHSDILYQTSDQTWEAYNTWGGNSLYQCAGAQPPAPFASDTKPVCPPGNPQGYQGAFAVSYNRPWHTALDDNGESWLFNAEFPMIEFLEKNGYDVSYTSESDVDANGSLLLNHKAFLSSGHDEYWSANQRANVTYARDHGVSLAFFSGNEVFWKTRWLPSIDGSNTSYRTLVTYKETHFNAPTDPQDPGTWTGTWEDPRFSPPADGGNPPNSLTGQFFAVNSGTTDIQVPSQYAPELLWRNTAVAKLAAGQSVTLGKGLGTLGYEWDIDADNGFRPAGEIDLSSTTENANAPDQVFPDYGTNVVPATVTHHLSLYKTASGSYVFGAGTVQFAYGLASSNPTGAQPDPNMEQFTVNLFALMGAQPTTLTTGLVAGSASTDTTPPTSKITSPAPGTTFTDGAPVTITGTATDAGGGVVAGVEVSTDGGNTWHPATVTPGASTTWSYSWVAAHGSPTATIESRATDDSGNIETPSDSETVNVTCPCSIWGQSFTPTVTDSGSSSPVEVGVKFTSDTYGTINGIRFYKSTANSGTHVGNLWTASGQLLASATFTNESTSGWQSVSFSQPVPVLPHTTYVASYFAPKGHTASDDYYLYQNPQPATMAPTVADSPPLHAIRSTATNGGDGVYTNSSSSTFPANADTGTNYWVDVSFTPQPAPGAVTNVTATAGYSSATLAWSAPTTGGPPTSYVITPYIGGVAQQTTTVTGSPAPTTATVTGLTNGTSYTFKVTASNPAGSGAPSALSNAATPSATAPPVFVQQAASQAASAKTISVQPSRAVTAGNRLVVEVAAYNSSKPSVTGVTDTAGDPFTQLSSTTAPDGTVLTVWTAVVTYSGGTQPTITATASAAGDLAISALEYAGLSTANGTAVLDSSLSASGTTGTTAATVSSGTTAAAGHTNELALGLYADSGYSDTLTAGSGWTLRSNVSPVSTVELFAEDQLLNNGATATATVGTGAKTPWALTALLLKPASATPPTAPNSPSNVTATAGNGSATVSWTAPDNGGSIVTSYTVTPYTGSTAGTPVTVANNTPNASTTITGLTSGTTYTFTVSATNSVGTSAESAPSNAVTPQAQAAPGAPTAVSAVAGNGSATVSWTAPSNGGSPITSYTITPYTTGEGSTALTPMTITGTPPATTATVSGLANGTTYQFAVSATNAIGTGLGSTQTAQVTPAGPPLAPTGVSATAGPASANVTWTAPDPQGSPITSYTVTPYVGSTAQVPQTVSGSPPATSSLMAGLTDGTSYTFVVTATNALGTSVSSAPSAAVTPADVPAPPAAVTAVTSGSGSLSVSWTPQSNSGSAVTSYTVTPYVGTTAGTPVTVSGSPPANSTTVTGLTNGSTYTFVVVANNAIGASAPSAASNPATPVSAPEACPCTIFGSQVPSVPDAGDNSSVNVGTAFTTDTNGYITGMRFYKASTNTGTHVGSLWSASGTLLAQATFTNETASGWQQVSFSTPVVATAGTTYVVSYYDPNGHYAQTLNGLSTPASGPPVYALASGNAPNGNGVFTYASTTAFPVNTYQSSNYWVDPVYNQTLPSVPAAPTGVTASVGNGSATVSWTAPPGSVTSYTVTPYVGTTAGTPVTVSGSPPATTTTVTGLTNGITYTFKVTAINAFGTGPASAASNAVTPASVPGSPTSVTAATAGSGSVTVSWTAPSSSSTITSYTVTPYVGSTAGTPVTVSGSPPATTTTFSGLTNGTTYTFKVSATSVIGTGTASTASNPATPQASLNCPCNVFGTQTPGTVDSGDATAVNLGMAFTTDTTGYVTGVRFYKASANTGTHVGSLWSASGTLLAQATFTNETASGWQQVSFSTPVAVTAGTTYVVSYYDPKGHYSVTANGLTNQVAAPPLYALASANAPKGNGLYVYSSASAFPTSTYQGSNYFVDPVFSTAAVPAAPTGVTATAGNGNATVSWTAPSGSVTSYTVTPYVGTTAGTPVTVSGSPPATTTTVSGLTNGTTYTFTVKATNSFGTGAASAASNAVTPASVPGSPTAVTAATAGAGSVTVSWTAPSSSSTITSYTVTPYAGKTAGTPVTVSGSPPATTTTVSGLTNGTTYTFTVSAASSAGTGPASAASNPATPEASLNCPCNVFGTQTPGTVDSGDGSSVNLGMAFTTDTTGSISGVRFYKASANTGTHVGSLWSASGTLLAQATFTNETASGWQQVSFSSPVAVTPGTTYVVSYYDPKGHYSVTANGLTNQVAAPPLYALASANAPNGNGVFLYSGSPAFPTSTYQGSNYFVDPVFSTTVSAVPGSPTAVTAATAGSGSVTVSWTAPSSSSSITSYTVTPYVGSTAGTPVTVSGSPPATTTTVSGLTNGTTYTFNVSATSSGGTGTASSASNPATPQASLSCPCNVFGTQTPGTVDSGDGSSVNLGMAFTTDTTGYVTGVRFYKASANTGTHVGSLWSASGTLLAQATFTNETASGWQQVSFSTPVAVTAGTTYVVSYYDPNGHYSVGAGGLTNQVSTPPLYAPASANAPNGNGVFVYNSASAFPTSTYQGSNYFVDPVFSTTAS